MDNCDLASTEKKARDLMLYYPYMKVNIEENLKAYREAPVLYFLLSKES